MQDPADGYQLLYTFVICLVAWRQVKWCLKSPQSCPYRPYWLKPNCHMMLLDIWCKSSLIQNVVSCVLFKPKDVTDSFLRLISVTLLRRISELELGTAAGEKSSLLLLLLAHCVWLQQVRLLTYSKLRFSVVNVCYAPHFYIARYYKRL